MSVRARMPGRGAAGGVLDARGRLPRWVTTPVLPAAILALLFLYPEWYSADITWLPTISTAVIICVFVIMALGLNIVVGYAGLLDLGYVAFYAAGAYIAGWLASQHFAQREVNVG